MNQTDIDQNFMICLTKHKIDVLKALNFVNSPHCGATSIFVGTTRISENKNDSKQVSHLIYEAYWEMAIKVMREIVADIVLKIDVFHKVYICHRVGQVDLGQESLVIAVSSPHRSSGHQMVMQILNEIKQKVPIWKKVCFNTKQNECSGSFEWSTKSEGFWLEKQKN